MSRLTLALPVMLGLILIVTSASAVIESSCPAPCTKPPKANLFVRETAGVIGTSGPVSGTLARGQKRTALRLDGSADFQTNGSGGVAGVNFTVNGIAFYGGVGGFLGETSVPCPSGSTICGVTWTYWIDIDAAEASNPGVFIDQPLVITLLPVTNSSPNGSAYKASFSAQVVKKK